MSDDPRRPSPGDPLQGEDGGERDAFGNPAAPQAPAGSDPAPAVTPGYGPSGDYAPPTGAPPAAPGPPPPPAAPAPGAPPPGYGPPPAPTPLGPGAPPAGPTSPPPAPTAFAGHQLASWGQRTGASAINAVFRLAAAIPGIAVIAAGSEVVGVLVLIAALIWNYFLYAPVFMMRSGERNGQSPGKQMVGIRVVREDSGPITFGSALLREVAVKLLLFETVGGFFFALPTALNYLWPLWDEQNRALHDMVVSTRVVQA